MKDRYRRRSLLTVLAALALVAVAVLVPGAGAGGAPSLAFIPSSHDYGTIDSGTTGTQSFTLTNSGGVATAALKVSLAGSAVFLKTADSCTAVSLGPKKSCSVTVQYAPTTEGSSDTGTLTASSKKPLSTASASLTGASTAVPTKTQSQVDCESFGGTFTVGTAPVLWECDNAPGSSGTLQADCLFTDGGNAFSGVGESVTCTRFSG